MRLFVVECRRDLRRRLTLVLVLLFVAVVVVGIGIAWINIDTYSDTEIETLQEEAVRYCVADAANYGFPSGEPKIFEVEPGVFVETPTGGTVDEVDTAEAERRCREQLAAMLAGESTDSFSGYLYYDDPRPSGLDLWDPDSSGDSAMGIIAPLLMIAGMGAAASMVGAEWKAGTVTTQLTWTSNRVAMFAAKVAAAVVLAAAIAFALQIFYAVLVYGLIVGKGGATDMIDGAWLGDLAAGMVRTSFLVGIGAAVGTSLAMVFRSTAGAIIVVFGYVAVAETLLRQWQPDWAPWLVGENLTIVLTGELLEGDSWEKAPIAAAVTLLVYAAALAVAAAADFHRRDIAGTS
jgi:hypothetical protein